MPPKKILCEEYKNGLIPGAEAEMWTASVTLAVRLHVIV